MSILIIAATLLVAAVVTFILGFTKAKSSAAASGQKLHSRAGYYGSYLAIWTALPALIITLLWGGFEQTAVSRIIMSELPPSFQERTEAQLTLTQGVIASIASGIAQMPEADLKLIEASRQGFRTEQDAKDLLQNYGVVLGSPPDRSILNAALHKVAYTEWSRWLNTILAAVLAVGGLAYAWSRIAPRLKARNVVETVTMGALIAASTVAILTTVGIIFSVVFETINFFESVPPDNFLFGTVWDPRFASADNNRGVGQFGLLPLLWGTLFISGVALLVAVPIGLFSAIYMAEYASDRVRAFAKPALEVLAGIPTIVYGFFALITFGPFLRDYGSTPAILIGYLLSGMLIYFLMYMLAALVGAHRAVGKNFLPLWIVGIVLTVVGFNMMTGNWALDTLGQQIADGRMLDWRFWLPDAEISASSVLTAGIVMGIMIIPFVSSLSDDIITSVPQSLRDGSFGLGATKSETIRQVVLPAALPGIVGAVLLAASRAIGETMIVVLAAGIAANLTINPFESVTTMTVKIVSQLTGDLEFTSPQTLVAFALGLSLFFITLALNVVALYIVRRYKEQYD